MELQRRRTLDESLLSDGMPDSAAKPAGRGKGHASNTLMQEHEESAGRRNNLELASQISDIPRRKEYVLKLKNQRAKKEVTDDGSENFDQFDIDLHSAVYP